MKTSKVVSVTDTGKRWNDLLKLEVELEDGTRGVANAKSADPWYCEPGTEVLYEATDNQYGTMLKVKKPDGAPPSSGQRGFHAGLAAKKDDDYIPQTLCHCIAPAVEMVVQQCNEEGVPLAWNRLADAMVVLYKARDEATEKLRAK